METITAQSIPQYNTSFLGMGGQLGWACADWVAYHKALLSAYNKSDADNIWAKAWVAGISKMGGGLGSAPGSGIITDSVPLDCRTFDSAFRNYINQSGNDVLKAAVFSGVLGSTVGKALSTSASIIDAAGNIITNTAKGADTASKVLKIAIPSLLILAALGLTWYGYKKIKAA